MPDNSTWRAPKGRTDLADWRVRDDRRTQAAPEFALCESASARIPFDHAALVLAVNPSEALVLEGSDPALERLAQQEQTVMQGPITDALESGQPMSHPDLRSEPARWPLLAAAGAIAELEVRSLIVLPLGLAGSRDAPDPIGALVIARDTPSPFSASESTELESLVERILMALIARWRVANQAEGQGGLVRDDRHLASGMLANLMGISVSEATAVMRARAFSGGRTLQEVAADVVAGFAPGPPA